jgi:bifunctional UDP-N-acetylglucosamine pyrophosphorylase/glucosamine-1-phosphate N-acetyltransferase
MGLHVVILAAGSGTRMKSAIPKVLHTIGGLPMLEHVVRTASTLNPDRIHVIYGNGGDTVPTALAHLDVNWVLQAQQLGTGHAVMQALPFCGDDDQVLVLYGDVPLITTATLLQLLKETPHNGLGLIVTEIDDPSGFGRIVRNEMGNILAIVEHKDASEAQLLINEINTGILTTTVKHLQTWLPAVKNQNKQNEYYLTDIVALAVEEGSPVGGVLAHCHEEVQGVNDRWQQASLEQYYQYIQAKRLASAGVTLYNPATITVHGELEIGCDSIIESGVVFKGQVTIGKRCHIGPNCVLTDVNLGDDVQVLANSVLEGAQVADEVQIGPFARLRPGTVVESQAKIGNFVEVKKSTISVGSKVSHLSYIGDATIGQQVNIGAGTIICNYDGQKKSPTTIGDGAFVGSHTCLVAPVSVGKNAVIGAGSVVTKAVPADKLTLTLRLDQRSVTI